MDSGNSHVKSRLSGIRQMLMAAYNSGFSMSSATKGNEREAFINLFLCRVFPPSFRFGCGDVTDDTGSKSGELDIVIEFPFLPSLPLVGVESSRLYMAESVAAAVEVKSNVCDQWNDVVATASKLSVLQRKFREAWLDSEATPSVPLYAVGYKGWSTADAIQKQLRDTQVQGVLVVESCLYVGKDKSVAEGDWCLWGLLADIQHDLGAVRWMSGNIHSYAPAKVP